jgi:replication fork clamp-binding protein CrfC
LVNIMTFQAKTDNFLGSLEKVTKVRGKIADRLENILEILKRSQTLSLDSDIKDITLASQNLRRGVFRLLVLGDLKRGKSTFLNALIGENLLPSDVNPCTAILTVLRYGKEKQVTVYFKNDRSPQVLDFKSFKQQYTIDPDEAKALEKRQDNAFPDVDYAVVEYPLPLLEKGIEIIDTPGLNDTEARNRLSLSYINNCHAILFVFRAVQPCTLEEKRYLENYLKGRNLSLFFLVNAWDEIQKELIDAEDREDLEEAETKLRQVFRAQLTEYCQVDGKNLYDRRVFELSSLEALRRQIKNSDASLEGTGFPEFIATLEQFLLEEKAIVQFKQARHLIRKAYDRLHEAIARRLPLLSEDVTEIKQRIKTIEPEFQQLNLIRDRFINEIENTRDRKAKEIADSLKEYILNLSATFETDFVRYQPSLSFFDFLLQGRREEFQQAFKQAFERYISEQILAWERSAEQKIEDAFLQLARSAADYGDSFRQITDSMTEKLTGQKVCVSINSDDNSPSWASWAMGFFSLATGNVAGVFMASAGFNWKNILVNWIAAIGISSFLAIFVGGLIAPLGVLAIPILGMGVGAFQTTQAREDFIRATKKEFAKYLPQIAQEQWQPIYDSVKECFDTYKDEASKRINGDIQSRKAELDTLIEQKESQQIDTDKEIDRLQNLEAEVLKEVSQVDSFCKGLGLIA